MRSVSVQPKHHIPGSAFLAIGCHVIMLSILVILVITSAGMGFMNIPPEHVARIIFSACGIQTDLSGITPVMATIVMDVRLPRILSAAITGGCLGISGAVFQAILLNPLADPYTLGMASGAAFGASLSLLLALTGMAMPGLTEFSAFAGAMLALMAVIYLAADDSDLSSSTLILSGVIVSSILSAAIGFMKYLADEQVGVIIFWLMGSFSGVSWKSVAILASSAMIVIAVSIFYSKELNIMTMGGRVAGTLGVNPALTRRILLVTCSMATATCVSVSGIIGFVGLIVPHMLRTVIGPDNRIIVPLSFTGGAVLLLGADTITRAVLPSEVPIGVLTSLIGGPFFCFIFRKRNKGNTING